MGLRRTYPQHSAREQGTGALFLAAIVLAFAFTFVLSIPQAFALEQEDQSGTAAEPTEAIVSETVPVQTPPLIETLSGMLAQADTAWANSQTDLGGYTNQTVSLVVTQHADILRVFGIVSFIAIGLGGLAIAFVMRRNDAPRAKVLHI